MEINCEMVVSNALSTGGDSDSDGSVVKRKKILDSDDDGLSDIDTGGGGDGVTGKNDLLNVYVTDS